MTFEEKVRSLSFKEILGFLIEGLENPVYKVDMSIYAGTMAGQCVACAATNAICKIVGKSFPENGFANTDVRRRSVNSQWSFFDNFEFAINSLRRGKILSYNEKAEEIGIALCFINHKLPELRTINYKENLIFYKEFYNTLLD